MIAPNQNDLNPVGSQVRKPIGSVASLFIMFAPFREEKGKEMKTIVGLFDSMEQAKKAGLDLEAAGIAHDDISFVANNETGAHAANNAAPTVTGHAVGHDAKVGAGVGGVAGLIIGLTGLAIPGLGWIATAGWLMGAVLGAGTGAIVGGLVGALTHVGVPAEDASHYTEGVRRGGTLVAVRSSDEMAMRVAEILGDDGAVDIDERAKQYASDGYVAPVATSVAAPVVTAPAMAASSAAASTVTATNVSGQTTIPIVEESLVVGKREVERGGVQVYTHITQTPVQEQVTLREEHVTVDRHPVDRAVTAADMAAMQDKTLNVTTMAEEAVVSKQARVVEEVTIGKQASEHVETVQDTVRRTDVDVEEVVAPTTATTSTTTTASRS